MKFVKTTIAAGLLVATGAASAVELSGNVALTSDYVWRGVSQTDGSPAIQGGFDLGYDSGAYLGVWGSNVDFGGDESMEFDVYGGWAGDVAEGLGLDVGFIHYHYPTSASGTNFTELYVGLSFGPVGVTQYFGVDLGDETIGDTDFGDYTDISLDIGEFGGIALAAHAGYYDVNGGDDYWDWKLGASKSLMGVDVELAYTDTDESGSDDDAVILTFSKSL
jgi:uncharacterized protein (TIGR02001 family)